MSNQHFHPQDHDAVVVDNPSDPESLKRARSQYANLMQLISDLGGKVSDVGHNHEQEFLSAYRVHQVNIQLELKELKQKVSNAQESLTIDGDVAKQEEECAWFRSETVRLSTHYENMRCDMKAMVSRLKILREQVAYLGDQLKTVLKRSMILESELKGVEPETLLASKGTSIGSLSSTNKLKKTKQLRLSESEPVLKQVNLRKTAASYSAERLESIQASQSRTTLKLDTMARSLNQQIVRDLTSIERSRNTIDMELEDSVKVTLKGVLERRTQAVVRGLKSRKSIVAAATSNNLSAHNVSQVTSGNPWEEAQYPSSTKCEDVGLSGLGLQHFMPTDKYSCLVHFLSKPVVFASVVEALREQFNQTQQQDDLCVSEALGVAAVPRDMDASLLSKERSFVNNISIDDSSTGGFARS